MAGVVAVLLLAGCAQEFGADVSTADFGPEDVTECRELGGGWRYVAAGDANGSTATVQHGPDRDEEFMSARQVRRAWRKAAANGWTEENVDTLLQLPDDNEFARSVGFEGTDAELDAMRGRIQRLLEASPPCDK